MYRQVLFTRLVICNITEQQPPCAGAKTRLFKCLHVQEWSWLDHLQNHRETDAGLYSKDNKAGWVHACTRVFFTWLIQRLSATSQGNIQPLSTRAMTRPRKYLNEREWSWLDWLSVSHSSSHWVLDWEQTQGWDTRIQGSFFASDI